MVGFLHCDVLKELCDMKSVRNTGKSTNNNTM